MVLKLYRKYKKQSYTIGNLYINNTFFSNTLEDTDRGLDDSMSSEKIKELKIPSITAIPKGTYKITLNIYSYKFGKQPFYRNLCEGKLPRLLDVKGFEGVLIHAGNTNKDTSGCILVGVNTIKGQVTNSRECFRKLYTQLKEAKDNGEELIIEVI